MGLGERLFGEAVDLAGLDPREAEFFANRSDQRERILAVGANSDLWITHEAKGHEETDYPKESMQEGCRQVSDSECLPGSISDHLIG